MLLFRCAFFYSALFLLLYFFVDGSFIVDDVVVLCGCVFFFFLCSVCCCYLQYNFIVTICRRRWAIYRVLNMKTEDVFIITNRQTVLKRVNEWTNERASEWVSELNGTSKWVSYIVGLQFSTKSQLFFSVGSEWCGFTNARNKQNKKKRNWKQSSSAFNFQLLFSFIRMTDKVRRKFPFENGIATPFCDHWRSLVYGFVCKQIDFYRVIGFPYISYVQRRPKFSVCVCVCGSAQNKRIHEQQSRKNFWIEVQTLNFNHLIILQCITNHRSHTHHLWSVELCNWMSKYVAFFILGEKL